MRIHQRSSHVSCIGRSSAERTAQTHCKILNDINDYFPYFLFLKIKIPLQQCLIEKLSYSFTIHEFEIFIENNCQIILQSLEQLRGLPKFAMSEATNPNRPKFTIVTFEHLCNYYFIYNSSRLVIWVLNNIIQLLA